MHCSRRAFLRTTLQALALAPVPWLTSWPAAESAQTGALPFAGCTGFAYAAHPALPYEQMLAEIRVLQSAGVNTIYIAHANPARRANQVSEEVGLCYALFDALQNASQADRDLAQWSIESVHRLLRATSEAGMQVVLPTGYQIQMGDAWSERFPNEIRRTANGAALNHWGTAGARTASPYSEQYRQDIVTYYAWVNQEFLARYPQIVVINLADEPMGADFSGPAKREFERRSGQPWAKASHRQRGQFLTHMLADYASWSAQALNSLHPVASMMTFHIQRESPWYPDMEAIFEQAPAQFVVSADTHLNDDRRDEVTFDDMLLLPLLCRTLGWLSLVYGRALMPWTSANAWGLSSKNSLADAQANFELVLRETKRSGGQLAMLMAWGKHIAGQDLPNQAEIETLVAARLGGVRDTLSQPNPAAQPPEVILTYNAHAVAEAASLRGADHLLPLVALSKSKSIRGRLAALGLNPAAVLRDQNSVILKRPGRAYDEALARNPAAKVVTLF